TSRGIHLDTGSATAIGSTHAAQGVPNQDAQAFLSLSPDTHLAIVADGVTHARIGSGEVASRIAIEELARFLPWRLRNAQTASAIELGFQDAFLETSRAILTAAETFHTGEPFDPSEVMSSTAVVGHLQGNTLWLANVGDSRAYLLADGLAEQLTVDGDVR